MVDSNICFLQAIADLTLIVDRDVATTFSVFQADYVTIVQLEFCFDRIVHLAVGYNLPFLKVLTDIGFIPTEEVFGVASSSWRRGSKFRLNALIWLRFNSQILREMNVSIIFDIVEKNLIHVDHTVTFLTIAIAGLDLKGHSTCRRFIREFQPLACFVLLS